MKRIIAAVAVLLLAATSASAQLGITAGLTSGATDVQTAYDDMFTAKTVDQYHVGLIYKIDLPFGLAVVPGVVYNMKGVSLQKNLEIASTSIDEVNIDSRTGYLEIPVQLRWTFGGETLGVFAFAEPYIGYAITTETIASAKSKHGQGLIETLKVNDVDEGAEWNGIEKLEYGAGAGLGVRLFNFVEVSAKCFWNMGPMFNNDGDASLSVKAMYETTRSTPCSGIAASVSLYF